MNAREELEEYFRALVPAQRVEQKMRELAGIFEALAEAQPITQWAMIGQAHIYLKTALAHPEIDARLRLDCLCTLCWQKREEAAALLPDVLQDELSADWPDTNWPDTAERLALWQKHRHTPDAGALADALLWEEVAQLVSNAVHLEGGEAARRLRLLLAGLEGDKMVN